jgi:phosphocarrier protein
VNRLGLHARPAAHFVRLASRFASDIYLSRDSVEVNGKSIMGVMMLAAEQGARIEIRAEGEDAEKALEGLVALVERGFDEDEEGRPVQAEGGDDG